MSESSNRIIIPLIKTWFSSFAENDSKPFPLWDDTIITHLKIEGNLPKQAKDILTSFYTDDLAFEEQKMITAFVILIEDIEAETIEKKIKEWQEQLKYFSVFYWTSCGNPIKPFLGLVINDNELVQILNTPRGNDPDGHTLGKATSHGITHGFLNQYVETIELFKRIPNALGCLAPFFDLTSAGFDSISLNARITLWISAIESLLIPGVDLEITHQLSIRASFFASEELEERKLLYRKFKALYRQRSKYIHGETHDISTFKFDGERLNTVYQLKQKFIYPIFRKVFNSKELVELRSSKADNYALWNNHFSNLIFK